MNTLNKIAYVLSKVTEVVCWIAVAAMLVSLFCGIFAPQEALTTTVDELVADTEFTAGGMSMGILTTDGTTVTIGRGAVIVFAVSVMILATLVAMIFRNVCLIIKTSKGETKFSKGATPFQPDNIRMLKEIGIFAIALPVVELVMNVVMRLVIGADNIEISVGLTDFLMGLLVLWLTQVFAYGAELQGDADGLI